MSKEFRLQSKFQPAGDQPNAIKGLVSGLESGLAHATWSYRVGQDIHHG